MASTNIQSFSGDVTVTSNLTVDATTFHVDSVAGRIGIGKTDPAFAVDVSGIINATSLYTGGSELQSSPWSSDASDIYYTTGAVGIGTNSPAKTLEVQGTLRMSNASTGTAVDLYVTKQGTWDNGTIFQPSDFGTGPSNLGGYFFGRGGVSISGDGNYFIGGAYYDSTVAYTAGAAYIFNRTGINTWDQGAKIVPSDGAASDYFGESVGISGDGMYAIVGSRYADVVGDASGSAYIFTRTGTNSWDNGITLAPTDPAVSDYFGESVAISGDGTYAVVGARNVSGGGALYVFKRTGSSWGTPIKLVASDRVSNDRLGSSVAISGDENYIISGAPYRNTAGTYSGAVYIFKRTGTNTWDNGTKIVATDAAGGDQFGYRVAITNYGTYAIVGAPYDDGSQNDYGAAYIFKRTGTNSWDNGTKIVAPDGAYQDEFGTSVAISTTSNGVYAISAAIQDDDLGSNSGTVYMFKLNESQVSWEFISKFYAPRPSPSNYYFGNSLGMANDGTFVAGDRTNEYAYVFDHLDGLTSTTSITAEGTVLSFTGQHMCFPDGPMGQGQIVSANKNKYITLNGPLTTGAQAIKSSESLPVVCLSNVANDKNVFGVVDRHERGGTTRVQENGIGKVTQEKELGDNRVIVNSIGEGAMWVTNTNGNLVSGDYITTSNVAGYGQKQDDDTVHSYTVAKITMDCDFEPEDLPVQVIKKDAEGKNVLGAYGRIQWEDTDRTEKAYRIRYLTTEGQRTDQANAVWTAAYVGCTYHCG
jgi:hypothetical protein